MDDLVHLVGADNHRHPCVREYAKPLPERLSEGWIDPRGRFVEKQNPRFVYQGGGERCPLLLAARQLLHRPVGRVREVDEVEDRGHSLGDVEGQMSRAKNETFSRTVRS